MVNLHKKRDKTFTTFRAEKAICELKRLYDSDIM